MGVPRRGDRQPPECRRARRADGPRLGSRSYPHPSLVRPLIARLHAWSARTGRPLTIVSGTEPGACGGAPPGVDELAIAEARRLGLATRVHPADWKALGRRAGPLRNTAIVADADYLVAFWDLRSRGTADAIDKALGVGKVGKVYGPGGDEVPIEVVGDAVRAVLG